MFLSYAGLKRNMLVYTLYINTHLNKKKKEIRPG